MRWKPLRAPVCRVLPLLAAACAVTAGTAHAAPQPAAPADADAFVPPSIAIDGSGATTIAWNGYNVPWVPKATLRTPASPAFAAPFTLVPADARANLLGLASNARGDTVILHNDRYVISEANAFVRLKAPGQASFGPSIAASAVAPGDTVYRAAVAIDEQGAVTVAWIELRRDFAFSVKAATLAAGSGAFSAPVELAAPARGAINELHVAADGAGGATAAWIRDTGRQKVVQASDRDGGQLGWSAPQNLSADGSGGRSAVDSAVTAEVAAGPDGGATVAWTELSTGLADVVQAARRLPGAAAFGPPQTLSDPRADNGAANPRLAIDPRGDAVVAWDVALADIVIGSPEIPTAHAAARAQPAAAPPPRRVQGAYAAAGAASFGAAFDVSDPTRYADQPHLAANPRGGFVLEYNVEPEALVELTTRGPGPDSSFGPPRTIATVYSPQLAVGPDGDATILWGRDHVPWIDGTDATAPTPDLLSIPERGFAGQPLTFSVTPHDRSSALAATRWSFGDGSDATGDAVTHAFAEPGVRQVTVTVADALGNGAAVTRAVTIVPVPVAPGRGQPGGGGVGGGRRPAPRITRASLTPRRVRPGRRGGLLIARRTGRTGTRLRFRASAAGTVALTLARVQPGRRAGRSHRCSTRARSGRRCTVVRTVARGSKRVRAGLATLALSGRAGRRALARGDYRLQLRLTDAAGGRSALVTLRMQVVR